MIGADGFLFDRQRPLQQRLGLRVAALRLIEAGKLVQRRRRGGMIGAKLVASFASPVTIITGFLGAGKTTLLNALLRDPVFSDPAVLINEFGDVSIDHDLVAEFSDDLVTTTTGCMCCSASSDIKQSLYDLWQRRKNREIGPFKRVIIESTGLLDPVPVLHAMLAPPMIGLIDRIVTGQFALAQVVTLYDIVNGQATLESHMEALKQIAVADVVILTKSDLANDPATRADIDADRQHFQKINPGAQILDRHADWPEIRAAILRPGTYDLRSNGDDALAWLKAEAMLAPTVIGWHRMSPLVVARYRSSDSGVDSESNSAHLTSGWPHSIGTGGHDASVLAVELGRSS